MAAVKIMSCEEGLPLTLTPKEGASQEDLIKSFTFGRGKDCSMVVTSSVCPKNLLFNISKNHFLIAKCLDDNLTYITDLSKNGTFVNEKRLGTGNRQILKDNDKVAVSTPLNVMYIFKCLDGVEDFLPVELMDIFANVRLLGRGSCGEVRLVKDRKTLKQFAVKKIILSESNSSQVYKINHPNKVNNEILILKKLSHPCVITMSDIVYVERECYLVLEYMAGGELTHRVPMTEDMAKFYFIQMALAVQYLHSCGVIHRDLKPENILLLDNREETLLKITDFGLSKITNENDATTKCGTLRYVAPEVINPTFRDYGEYGKEVDIWSLGVIVYCMISGMFPFSGEENGAIIQNILKCNYNLSDGIWSNLDKEAAKDLIRKILQLLPRRRLQIVQMFEHDWIKQEHGVKLRVKKLLEQEGLQNPMQELSLEPSPKRFKFSSNHQYSSSSDESNTTLTNVNGSFNSSPTICC